MYIIIASSKKIHKMGEIEVSVHSKADDNINFVKENVNHGIN